MIDKALIEALKNGDTNLLKTFYLENQSAFLGFTKRYNLDESVAKDIYQDTILALRENALKGNLDNLKNELKTYVFSIGKYKIYNYLKTEKRNVHLSDINDFKTIEEPSNFLFDVDNELTEEQEQLRIAYASLGEKCKELLTLFYYRGLNLEEIMEKLKYTNKDVVKSQKSRCLKTLKSKIFKIKK